MNFSLASSQNIIRATVNVFVVFAKLVKLFLIFCKQISVFGVLVSLSRNFRYLCDYIGRFCDLPGFF